MSSFKLVAVDMDGTLLNSSLEISEKNRLAINELLKNDIKVIFATGRTFKAAQYYAEQLKLDLPIVTYNGALIKKVLSEEVIYSSKIELSSAKELLKFAEDNKIYTKVYIDDILLVARESEDAAIFSRNNRIFLRGYEHWKFQKEFTSNPMRASRDFKQ